VLSSLNRKDEAVLVCDIIVNCFDNAKEPTLREVIAGTLLCKLICLHELGRKKKALDVCDEIVRRYSTANEPALRKTFEAVLLTKKMLFDECDKLFTVENCEIPPHNPPMPQPVKTGDATTKKWMSLREYNAIQKVILGNASPEDRALAEGMVAREESKSNSEPEPPFPELPPGDVEAVIKHGEKRPWGKRREFGYKWTTSVFEFVQAEYGKWIPGLTQGHLKSADEGLWSFFSKRVSTHGLPNWLDVPSEPDAELRKITDPVEREQRKVAREVERKRSQARRTAKRPQIQTTGRLDLAANRR